MVLPRENLRLKYYQKRDQSGTLIASISSLQFYAERKTSRESETYAEVFIINNYNHEA